MLTYEIATPENVRFRLERAGLASRGVAWALDMLVMAALLELSHAAASSLDFVHRSVASAAWIVAAFLVQWWYGALCEWKLRGRTVGKWILGLMAVDGNGGRMTFRQALVRNLLRAVDWLPGLYLVGGAVSVIDGNGRRLGDLAADTLVIRDRRRVGRLRPLQGASKEGALPEDLQDAVGRLSSAERDAISGMCADRDRLPTGLRVRLFERLAAHLLSRLELAWPPHVSAENIVLELGAALSRRQERGSFHES